jgi:hypothetical protein
MLYHELGQIIVAEWIVWVPTMFLTFRFAPVKFQVLVINLVGVGWQTVLSLMSNMAHTKHLERADSESEEHTWSEELELAAESKS